jgi:hypothetical protein
MIVVPMIPVVNLLSLVLIPTRRKHNDYDALLHPLWSAAFRTCEVL